MTAAAPIADPRMTLARPDLAEQALEGFVRASAFRTVQAMHCVVPVADLHTDADPGPDPVDQLIFGEIFDALDRRGDRLWGRARRDGVVGWIDAGALTEGAPLATHRIGAVDADLPLNALLADPAEEHGLAPVGAFAAVPVEVAERLLGVPHRLGARTSRSTDCCGLIQQALYACGLAAPRYADQQAEMGRPVHSGEACRGDLVVWLDPVGAPRNGHSAFMLDSERVLHATGHHGAVVIESLAEADARCRSDGLSPLQVRRL